MEEPVALAAARSAVVRLATKGAIAASWRLNRQGASVLSTAWPAKAASRL